MINVPKLEECIVKEYQYGAILDANWKRDTTVYLQPYIRHLIQNYSAAFVQLAYVKNEAKDYDDALKYLAVAGEISPHLEAPKQYMGYYLLDAGDTTAAINHYVNLLREKPGDDQLSYRLAGVYERVGRYSDALELIDPLYRKEPDAKDLSVMVFTLAARAGMVDRAKAYMEDWLKRHPEDTEGREALQEYERQLGSEKP
jgi:tetratricopeptide (TPR) repeat protein